MPVRSAPYYWVECDGCGERIDYGDYTVHDGGLPDPLSRKAVTP